MRPNQLQPARGDVAPPTPAARRGTARTLAVATALLLAVGATAGAAANRAAAPVRVLDVTTRDYAFDAPDTVAAGRTLVRLHNAGTELHHVAMLRLGAGKRMSDLFEAMQAGPGPLPAWATEVGGPNAVVPDSQSEAALTLQPGRYVLLCFVPSKDGQPHVMKGMAKELTVVPVSAAAASMTELRAPDVTMTLKDYTFALSKPLAAGRHVVRVRNTAAQHHEVVFVRLAPGKKVEDLAAWVAKQDGPPPGMPIGGTVGLAQGQANDVVLDLPPGEYGLICFLPDAKDGKEHAMHGMMKQFTIK